MGSADSIHSHPHARLLRNLTWLQVDQHGLSFVSGAHIKVDYGSWERPISSLTVA